MLWSCEHLSFTKIGNRRYHELGCVNGARLKIMGPPADSLSEFREQSGFCWAIARSGALWVASRDMYYIVAYIRSRSRSWSPPRGHLNVNMVDSRHLGFQALDSIDACDWRVPGDEQDGPMRSGHVHMSSSVHVYVGVESVLLRPTDDWVEERYRTWGDEAGNVMELVFAACYSRFWGSQSTWFDCGLFSL